MGRKVQGRNFFIYSRKWVSKMVMTNLDIENILIIVCTWHHGLPGQMGADFFKMIVDRARDLLTSLHQ
jgi:hypothetical protein